MITIYKKTMYEVNGKTFTSEQAAIDYINDQFGEFMSKLIGMHTTRCVDTNNIISAMVDPRNRETIIKLLSFDTEDLTD